MHKELKCPYCGRGLQQNERFCWFCECNLSEMRDASEKPNCFIASAVYGESSYEVMVLREFRDNTLRNNFFGRAFISVYYALSPGIARISRRSKFVRDFLKGLIRIFLRIIQR